MSYATARTLKTHGSAVGIEAMKISTFHHPVGVKYG